MASSAALLAAQGVADSLGIAVSKSNVMSALAHEGEGYAQQVIGGAALLCANGHTSRLTVQHINRILVAKQRPPLLGYEAATGFQMMTIPCEQHELFAAKEVRVELSDATDRVAKPLSRGYGCEYLLTEGVPSDRKNLSNRRLIVKGPRADKATAGGSGTAGFEVNHGAPVHIARRVYAPNQLVADVMNDDMQEYFMKVINLMHDDLVYSKDSALNRLSRDPGIQQLVPYFLQFVFGQMTMRFQESSIMCTLIAITSAIVRNHNISTDVYAHAILKIAISALIGADYGSPVECNDSAQREQAAELLGLICRKYSAAYPSIESVVYNRLIRCLFTCETTLMAHYGALAGIRSLGVSYVRRALPHVTSYAKIANLERLSTSRRQGFAVDMIRDIVDDLSKIAS